MSETQIMIADSMSSNSAPVIESGVLKPSRATNFSRSEVTALIESTGVVPALRFSSASDVLFAAEALADAGIPVVEISTLEAGALDMILELSRRKDEIVVGAGSVFTTEAALRCLEAGAKFLTSDIFVPQIVELAVRENVAIIPGALTPTEVMAAWTAGADFVKVTPCGSHEHDYIRSLKMMMPDVRLIAAGGVNQTTALSFVKAGAAALSVGAELVRPEAVWLRQRNRIREMARRFRNAVVSGREAAN